MSSDDEKKKDGIKKFNGSNYRTWAKSLEFKLRGKGLWQCITEAAPDQPFRDNFVDERDEAAIELAYRKAKKKWKSYKEKEAKTMDKIYNSVTDPLQPMIEECQTAQAMWTKLKDIFAGHTTARGQNPTQIRATLSRMEYTLGDGIDEFFAKVQREVNALYEIEGKIGDEEITTYLFIHMPPELRYYQSALRETMTFKELTYLDVMERFRREVLQLERDMDRESAMMTKPSKKGSNSKESKKHRGKYCDHCKKPGHVIEKCFKKHPHLYEEYKKKQTEAEKTVKKRGSESNLLEKASEDNKKGKTAKRAINMQELQEFGQMATTIEVDMHDEPDDGTLIYSDDSEDVYYIRPSTARNQSLSQWVTDSGSSKMMGANRSYFIEIKELDKKVWVQVGNGARIKAEGIGKVVLHLALMEDHKPTKYRSVVIREVLFVPKLMTNLLSISDLAEVGVSTTFIARTKTNPGGPLRARFYLESSGKTVATATLRGKHYLLDLAIPKFYIRQAFNADIVDDGISLPTQGIDTDSDSDDEARIIPTEAYVDEEESSIESEAEQEYDPNPDRTELQFSVEHIDPDEVTAFQNLWHHRLGHVGPEAMRLVSHTTKIKDAEGLRNCKLGEKTCRTCAEGKAHEATHTSKTNHPFHTPTETSAPLEIVHIDTAGPIKPLTHPQRYKYFQVYIDHHSHYTTIAFLKRMKEGLEKMQLYTQAMENQLNTSLKRFKTDNGKEFVSKAHTRWYNEKGIIHETSTPYQPKENGKSERYIRTIQNRASCLLFTAGAPASKWDRAIAHASLLNNVLPNKRNPNNASPFEILHGYPPNLSLLRVWGCTAYVHLPKEKRNGKFGRKTIKVAHVGMKEDSSIYCFWNPKTRKTFYSSDVAMFDEADFSAICPKGNEPNGLKYMPNNANGIEKRETHPSLVE